MWHSDTECLCDWSYYFGSTLDSHACLGQSMRGIVYKINSSLRTVLELLPRANSQFIQMPCSELFCVLNSIQEDFLGDRVGVCVQFVQCFVKLDT